MPNFNENNKKTITESQRKYIDSLCLALNKPVPTLDIYTYEMATALITALQKEVQKNREFYASEQQLTTIKQYIKCPFIKKAFIEELSIIPQKWLDAKQTLVDECKFYEQMLTSGYARKKVCKLDEIEVVADYLFSNGYINEKYYEDLIWYRITLQSVLNTHELIEIDGLIYEKKIINKAYIQMKVDQLRERIVNANIKIQAKIDNPYQFLPKDETTRFISQYANYYKQWETNRLSDKQYRYITELHYRINGTRENTDGYKLLSKGQASIVIRQMEKEQSYSYGSIESDIERNMATYTGEEYTADKNVAWEVEDNKKWSTMLHAFNRFIGYKPEVEVGDLNMIKELINMSVIMGCSLDEITEVIRTSYDWSVGELQELGLVQADKIEDTINVTVEPVLEEVKRLLELGYISIEKLQGLVQN